MLLTDSPHKSADLSQAKILMVDDEPSTCELIEIFLTDAGYHNFTAIQKPTEFFTQLERIQPDLILLDLLMPEMDGFQILQQLRQGDSTRYLPVIVLTAASDPETKLRCLELEATEFLAKPVDQGELVLRVRNTLMVKAYQDQLAYYDDLTGLPNRHLFADRLNWSLEQSQFNKSKAAVLHLSLDKFRSINESYGPRMGDRLLKVVSDRILGFLKQTDVVKRAGDEDLWKSVARTNGDEFSILLASASRIEDASFIAAGIVDVVGQPFLLDGIECYVSCSIGIAMCPEDGIAANDILMNASNASQYAKQQGGNCFQFFASDVNRRLKESLHIQGQMRKAIVQNQFELHYQPQISSFNHDVIGVEALLRWEHPELGAISPSYFIPLAEDAGLIVEIGEWIFRHVCWQAAKWQNELTKDFKVSTNVSSIQLSSANFVPFIKQCIEESGVDPKKVVIEITESIAMADFDNNLSILKQITDLGLTISIDDFGTGYSSLSYIKNFPAKEIKIDKHFIDGIPSDKGDVAIVDAIITMAHKLDFTVVAEGVETDLQAGFLAGRNCDVLQGYHFHKPLTLVELNKLIV
ncbi:MULTISPECIES: EAL domain-containing protein [unclassified Neptuniibacter]|uniref:EAL domain-containing response regulator n=1 Tax=unclassified Neptuniibacter TaxID=2630693 RepID=UPI000C43AFD1|nr:MULTISPECIES: EAL domain-containing protein [unclassified Neptuniibacter]MAY43619.1 GGDEF domain-containing response regulator [Oceanospirillaceae bacterium]|tara:strand:+ start:7020 stop:8759 length:1740 start_codon:yes stop_codon:yes gene_type:complete